MRQKPERQGGLVGVQSKPSLSVGLLPPSLLDESAPRRTHRSAATKSENPSLPRRGAVKRGIPVNADPKTGRALVLRERGWTSGGGIGTVPSDAVITPAVHEGSRSK